MEMIRATVLEEVEGALLPIICSQTSLSTKVFTSVGYFVHWILEKIVSCYTF